MTDSPDDGRRDWVACAGLTAVASARMDGPNDNLLIISVEINRQIVI
jgi:hypothetical protein